MAPQLKDLILLGVVPLRGLHRALDHLREVARVEQVVRLARRRQELLGDGGVEFNRGFDDGVAQRFERVVEIAQVVVQ